MDVRGHAGRKIMPVVGGVTAAATAMGAWAPLVQVATAGADQSTAAIPQGTAGTTGAGTFESCSAYFGWGKALGALEVVDFDVVDQNGDDGVDHAVPDDVGVVLVLETTDGGTIECIPVEVTEEEWEDEYGFEDGFPDWPGPGHYGYPSVNLQDEIEELPSYGEVTDVGFRVTGIPGEHTLVSPADVHQLEQHFLDLDELWDEGIIDPRVLDLIEAEAGAAAVAAFEAAIDECYDEGDTDETDEDLIAAVEALITYVTGDEDPGLTEADCFTTAIFAVEASAVIAAWETTEYTEQIVLAVPDAPTPPQAAQPQEAEPQFTG